MDWFGSTLMILKRSVAAAYALSSHRSRREPSWLVSTADIGTIAIVVLPAKPLWDLCCSFRGVSPNQIGQNL